ncbi:secreted RxLR effector peptide protein, putative [Phytophthora infestans T30-4]
MHLLHQAMPLFAASFFLNVDAASKVRSLNRAVSKNQINRYLRVVSDDERGYFSSLGLKKTQEWINSFVRKITENPKPTQDNIPDETLSHVQPTKEYQASNSRYPKVAQQREINRKSV